MEKPNTLKLDNLTVVFCGKGVNSPTPERNLLPVMVHTCPDDFSTLDYFDVSASSMFTINEKLIRLFPQSLKTKHVGRLLLYSKILASSVVLLKDTKYVHGFAVIPRELTGAVGRGNNMVNYQLSHWNSSLYCWSLHLLVVESARMLDVLTSTPHSAQQSSWPENSTTPALNRRSSGDGDSKVSRIWGESMLRSLQNWFGNSKELLCKIIERWKSFCLTFYLNFYFISGIIESWRISCWYHSKKFAIIQRRK